MRKALVLGLILFTRVAVAADPSIFGFWRTYDDKTGRAKGLVEIVASEGEIKGILRSTLDPNAKATCEECPGDKKGKPIKDLEIFWGVKATDPNEWGGGHILDPQNGKTYRVRFELQDEGRKLKARGYLGISLLGRTQYWERTEGPKPEAPVVTEPADPPKAEESPSVAPAKKSPAKKKKH